MSNLDFEISEFEDRQQRTRAAMEKIGIDLLIVTNPVNINYLAGSRIKGIPGVPGAAIHPGAQRPDTPDSFR